MSVDDFEMLYCRNGASLINGVKYAKIIEESLVDEISKWCMLGQKVPQLVIILVGDDNSIESQVDKKVSTGRNVGIDCNVLRLPADVTDENLVDEIQKLNSNASIDGISVQLPIPAHLNKKKICNAISPEKDVDGFKIVGVEDIREIRNRLQSDGLLPCLPLAVQELLKRYGIKIHDSQVAIVAKSLDDCRPFEMVLQAEGSGWFKKSIELCNSGNLIQLEFKCKSADILVSAVGEPGLIEGRMVKPGAIIVDVGISRIVNPVTGVITLVGDLNLDAVQKVAGKIITIPGDLGPMTDAILMRNTFKAAKKRCQSNNYCSIQ